MHSKLILLMYCGYLRLFSDRKPDFGRILRLHETVSWRSELCSQQALQSWFSRSVHEGVFVVVIVDDFIVVVVLVVVGLLVNSDIFSVVVDRVVSLNSIVLIGLLIDSDVGSGSADVSVTCSVDS